MIRDPNVIAAKIERLRQLYPSARWTEEQLALCARVVAMAADEETADKALDLMALEVDYPNPATLRPRIERANLNRSLSQPALVSPPDDRTPAERGVGARSPADDD